MEAIVLRIRKMMAYAAAALHRIRMIPCMEFFYEIIKNAAACGDRGIYACAFSGSVYSPGFRPFVR